MNQLTVYAYEEDGELIVYRCPECGSTGELASACLHEPPMADHRNGWVEREPVRVPGVGEEPRASDKIAFVKGHLEGYADALGVIGHLDRQPLIAALREDAETLDHFTQQPAGVGADESKPAEKVGTRTSGEVPTVSADSDGNQQPLGGDADAGKTNVRETRRPVAEGDSVQCGGVALSQVIRDIERFLDHRIDPGAFNAYNHCLGLLRGLTQQSSGGQEAAEEFVSNRGANDKSSGGQEGGVEEGAIPKRWAGQEDGEHWTLLIEHDRMTEGEPCVVTVEVENWEAGQDGKQDALACATPAQARAMAAALRLYADEAEREDGSASTPPISDYKSGEGK